MRVNKKICPVGGSSEIFRMQRPTAARMTLEMSWPMVGRRRLPTRVVGVGAESCRRLFREALPGGPEEGQAKGARLVPRPRELGGRNPRILHCSPTHAIPLLSERNVDED